MSQKDYDDFISTLATNIKKARNKRGLTQEDMMDYGFNYRHYQKIESGTYSPNLHTIFRVAKALDVRISSLFKG